MKERFKHYLEEQFRQIAPTKEAMEYRKTMLTRMLDRAQELRIKGMTDDELIYATVIGELGDFASTLHAYEHDSLVKRKTRKALTLGVTSAFCYILVLVIAYLIVGCVAHLWAPGWLIIVGGVLLGVIALGVYCAVLCVKKGNHLALRVTLAGVEAILATVVFLFLQIIGHISGSWMTFLAMVALMACTDIAIAFLTGSKAKWFELPVCVEIICVMLYVILGVSLPSLGIWHPGWLLCLAGVVAVFAELLAYAFKSSAKKEKKSEKDAAVNEAYWTEWDD